MTISSRSQTVLLLVLLPLLAFLFGVNVGASRPIISSGTAPGGSGGPVVLRSQLIREVLDDIQKYYYQPERATPDAVSYGAAMGVVDALGDPHSLFFPPEDAQDFAAVIDGSLEGIGAELLQSRGELIVNSVLRNTPAQRAGVKAGDIIIEIDGVDTAGLTLHEAIAKIRGPKGTTVTLKLFHRDAEQPDDVVITRDEIRVPSVEWEVRDDGVAVISLSFFRDGTADELTRAAQELLAKQPKGIVLDLRNNPGGVLDEAVKVVALFVEEGDVVRQRGRDQERIYRIQNRQIVETDGTQELSLGAANPILQNLPLVVLVNESSASASEIVAGALQDHNRGTLVGSQTFGKGTVQELIPLTVDKGSELKLTVAEWFTPKDRSIEGVGLAPDVIVEVDPEEWTEENDPQLDAAVAVLTGAPLPEPPEEEG